MVIAYIGLGSNLGDREANLHRALDHVRESGQVEVLSMSGLVETDPIGGPSQPMYLNGVARIRTELTAPDLLALLQAAERAAGRKPSGVRWGPREADLDLLLFGDQVIDDAPELVVPHPRLRERIFVLEPLAAVSPDVRDPVTGKTVVDLLVDLRRRDSGRRSARLLTTVGELREYVAMTDRNRFTIGLVPTMGAFHEGHLSLMRAARESCDKVVVTLFVNPTQFDAGEDLEKYPRQLDEDLSLASEVGVDVVFAPTREEMYPDGFRTQVRVDGLSEVLCGAARPVHFAGVTTVVAKLLNLVKPETVFFGRKDFQQTVVIRRMAVDLDVDAAIRVLPTVREEDGLALSSRNRYLSPGDREAALGIRRALLAVRAAFDDGERSGEMLVSAGRAVLDAEDRIETEYVAVVDTEDLSPLPLVEGGAAVLIAGSVGGTRLIDNILLGGAS